MASFQFQLSKCVFAPVPVTGSNLPGKFSCFAPARVSEKAFLGLRSAAASRCSAGRRLAVSCGLREENNQTNGEEPTESLFMKELKRRGINPTSLLEDSRRINPESGNEIELDDKGRSFSTRNAVSTELEKGHSDQRGRSMALNSEGLEGLVPRAKLLLTLGGTFFLGFWPLILLTVAFFSALYFYFGPSFVHDASNMSVSPPQYIDPYALLEDERISQIAPPIN